MKRNHRLSLYNADKPPIEQKQESSSQPEQNKSPYLKAIFSGTAKLLSRADNLPVTNPDHAAALRYIKESAVLKKLYFGKMSC